MKRLLKVLLLVGIAAAIARLVMAKQEWSGFSEAQVRDKLDAGLARRVEDAEKRQEIADKVVAAMKDKGVIRDEVEAAMAGAVETATDAAESAVEAAADAVAAAEVAEQAAEDIKDAG